MTTRRAILQGLTAVPLVASTLLGCGKHVTTPPEANGYKPVFFTDKEWAFVHAACDRLIPADEHGPGAIEAGVPEFVDRHMQTPYARGDIWYRQGPYVETAPAAFGYQGSLAVRDILRTGMRSMDVHCEQHYAGRTFAELDHAQQEILLRNAEGGKLELKDIACQVFFAQLLAETRNGYFCDPVHGGNKNMGAWKMIGYPGMRADYTDWVEVRDRPYPLPPVDLAGRRS